MPIMLLIENIRPYVLALSFLRDTTCFMYKYNLFLY